MVSFPINHQIKPKPGLYFMKTYVIQGPERILALLSVFGANRVKGNNTLKRLLKLTLYGVMDKGNT